MVKKKNPRRRIWLAMKAAKQIQSNLYQIKMFNKKAVIETRTDKNVKFTWHSFTFFHVIFGKTFGHFIYILPTSKIWLSNQKRKMETWVIVLLRLLFKKAMFEGWVITLCKTNVFIQVLNIFDNILQTELVSTYNELKLIRLVDLFGVETWIEFFRGLLI